MNHAEQFLQKGHKVQFTIMFRGREMMHLDHGFEMFTGICESLEAVGKVEREPKKLGRRMTMVMAPK